jgi:hypothetical protein
MILFLVCIKIIQNNHSGRESKRLEHSIRIDVQRILSKNEMVQDFASWSASV